MNQNGILVEIIVDVNGCNNYPGFQGLDSVTRSGLNWSEYVDLSHSLEYCHGWIYDANHCHEPNTVKRQYAVLLTHKEFCEEAITRFPEQCKRLTHEQVVAVRTESTSIGPAKEVDLSKIIQMNYEIIESGVFFRYREPDLSIKRRSTH